MQVEISFEITSVAHLQTVWRLVNAALLLLWGSLYTPIRVKQIYFFNIQISILFFLRNITTGQKPLVKKQPVMALLSASWQKLFFTMHADKPKNGNIFQLFFGGERKPRQSPSYLGMITQQNCPGAYQFPGGLHPPRSPPQPGSGPQAPSSGACLTPLPLPTAQEGSWGTQSSYRSWKWDAIANRKNVGD